jgi:environmental stress-induced protein Ves
MAWKNGLGWTNEVAREPADEAEEFAWRVSVAEVDADCEFSRFVGIDRSILVLAGAGMELRIGEDTRMVVAGGPALAFAGEDGAGGRLLAGPTRDFNVMTRRGVYTHTLERVRVDGQVEAAGWVLTAGDCVRGEAVPGDSLRVHGVGEIVVVGLRRV